jgi:hypothetical protein
MALLFSTLFLTACSASGDTEADDTTDGSGAVGSGGAASGGVTGGSNGSGGALGFGGDSGTGSVATSSSAAGGAGAADPCSPPGDVPQAEQCGNGLDENLDGFVDESCVCTIGQTQPCFGGPPSQAALPNCVKGMQSCVAVGEFGQWGSCQGWNCGPTTPPPEVCDNGVDEDCDGVIDDGCSLTVPVDIDGDCLYAYCPPQAPYPIGCNIIMDGGDSRGCVANAQGSSAVYFKEGDACPNPICPFCDAGHISGTLLCSSQLPAAPLDDMNCPINKPEKFYPGDPSGCP